MSLDVVSFGETMLRLTAQEGARLEDTPTLRVYVGGSESNTLSGLARLNLKVQWISALPAQRMGKHVERELRRHGVGTDYVVWTMGSERLGIFYAEESPDPLGLHVIYDRANSACARIDPAAIDYSVIDNARLLHLTGITPALSGQAREVFRRFLERACARRVPLSFDVNYRAKLWAPADAAQAIEEACQQAEILFCARADAAELWGFDGTPEVMLRQMAARFTGPDESKKTFVLTLGSEGSAQLLNGEYFAEPAIPTDGHARFGSGDAFDAGYLYAYLDGPLYRELHEAYDVTPLAFGNALAALKRCIPGDIPVITPDDVKALLQRVEGRRFR